MHFAEHGITLRHGRHAGRLLRAARWYAGGDNRGNLPRMYNTAIYSDDGGVTWSTSEPFPELGTGEGAVAELSDGRIYYNSRRHADPPGSEYNPALRWEAWSEDGGLTWKDAAMCRILPDGARKSIGPGSGCFAGLVRLPVKGRDILLYSNCDSVTAERRDVTVWVSFGWGRDLAAQAEGVGGTECLLLPQCGAPGNCERGLDLSPAGGRKESSLRGWLPGPIQPELASGGRGDRGWGIARLAGPVDGSRFVLK